MQSAEKVLEMPTHKIHIASSIMSPETWAATISRTRCLVLFVQLSSHEFDLDFEFAVGTGQREDEKATPKLLAIKWNATSEEWAQL